MNRDAFQNQAQKQGPDQALKDFTNGDKMETAASSRAWKWKIIISCQTPIAAELQGLDSPRLVTSLILAQSHCKMQPYSDLATFYTSWMTRGAGHGLGPFENCQHRNHLQPPFHFTTQTGWGNAGKEKRSGILGSRNVDCSMKYKNKHF